MEKRSAFEERLIPMLNGRRVRWRRNPLPGTVFVTVSEFKKLMAQKQGKEPGYSFPSEQTVEEISKRRRGESSAKKERLIPMLNGKRVRRRKNPLPGTVFVPLSEYLTIIQKSTPDSQLDNSVESYSRAKKVIPKLQKPKPSISIKEQRTKIQTFAKEKSEEVVEQFTNEMIPDEIRDSMSDEQLQFKKHELSADLAETMNSRLYWAFYDAWLESQMRRDS